MRPAKTFFNIQLSNSRVMHFNNFFTRKILNKYIFRQPIKFLFIYFLSISFKTCPSCITYET